MADEELRELELTHGYGGSGGRWSGGGGGGASWGRSPGGGGSLSHQRMAPSQHHNRAAEAEDIMGRSQVPRGRSGLYYSPPGTSYTIVERPPGVGGGGGGGGGGSGGGKPRGTYLGSSASFTHNNNRTPASGKKRPISPEQVLQMLGHNHLKAPVEPHQTRRPAPPPPTMDQLTVRTVSMSRGPADGTQSHGFGICVKGGTKDSGVGVYISRVEEGSVAERAGLRPGDSILEVNGTPFTGISHEEALKMLKSCRTLSMTVRSPHPPPPPAPGGTAPWLVRQTYSWIDRQGRPVSPPPEYARASPPVLVAPPPPPPRWNYSRNTKDRPIRKVELCIEPGQSLGLMIRGGVEYNLGIFITGVDKDSVADRAGLMIGDQILEVNSQSFLDVTHDEAVNQLKFHKRMTLTVRDVGKVPHSCTAYDADPWDSPQARRIHASRSAALQMVDEKARVVLKKSEFSTLTYYLDEYSARQMTIEAFVAVLLELLNTPEKYTLLTELREVVMPEDRGRFDELVYRRESEGQRLQHMIDSRPSTQHTRRKGGVGCCDSNHLLPSMHHESEYGELHEEELDTRRHHSALAPTVKALNQPYDDANMCGYLEGLRSQLGGWTQKVKSWYWGNPLLAHKLGRGFDLKEEQELLESEPGGMRRHGSNMRLSRGDLQDSSADNEAQVVPDNQGNLRITVKKTKPLLGIAIEGGANTRHPLPRIINIHENGAAYDAGGLEVGQLILEVDGHKVEGMQHQEVARLIAESFARRERQEIEFLVVEAKKSNLEPKPTALIFLEA